MLVRASFLALATGTFALGMAEFAMMAILDSAAHGLGVSIPEAGHFISAYSIGVAVGAICLPLLNRLPMKAILLGLCGLIALGNTFATFAPDANSFFWARFISGLPHGAYFGVAAVVATRLAGYGEKASAVAIMISGMTLANLAGIPFATLISGILGWRWTFGFVAFASCVSIFAIWKKIPVMPPNQQGNCLTFSCQFKFLKLAAPWLIFGGTFFGQGALYCWYSYIEPAMIYISGFSVQSMAWIMIITGAGMFFGGLASGRLADKFPGGLVTALICALMIPTLLLIWLLDSSKIFALSLAFLGSAEIFALGGPLQYLIVLYSKGGELLGGAGIQVAFNLANAFSAWLGGIFISQGYGYSSPALAGIPLALLGAIALFRFYFMYEKRKAPHNI